MQHGGVRDELPGDDAIEREEDEEGKDEEEEYAEEEVEGGPESIGRHSAHHHLAAVVVVCLLVLGYAEYRAGKVQKITLPEMYTDATPDCKGKHVSTFITQGIECSRLKSTVDIHFTVKHIDNFSNRNFAILKRCHSS